MDKVIHNTQMIRIIEREGRLLLRYDFGMHVSKYREDEISKEEADIILKDKDNLIKTKTVEVLKAIRARLIAQGIDPCEENYSHEQYRNEKPE